MIATSMARHADRDPIRLYVLWHPQCEDGRAMARAVYDWFHASSAELLRAGLGLPVHYRSAPWSSGASRPRPIELEAASASIIVPLVDEHLVSDPDWVDYLRGYAVHEGGAAVYPVALHAGAYRLPQPIRRINYLRVDAVDDPPDANPAARLARRSARLRRLLTQVCARQLQGHLEGRAFDAAHASAPLTVFLSHAKSDGVAIAEALRGAIHDYGQLQAYYDSNDLPVGHGFADELTRAATTGSVAMISVLTDAYPARPWCRREIRLARTPRPDPRAAGCWSLHPVLVVDGLVGAETRAVPEFGNVPMVRWDPARADEILDALLLEVLVSAFHRLRARAIAARPGRQVISWVPDLPTVLELARHPSCQPLKELVYPGHGLPPYDRRLFADYFAGMRLRTFEEVT